MIRVKKFFAVAALILGIFLAQVSQAEAYQPREYDLAFYTIYRCQFCNSRAETLSVNFKETLADTRTATGCPNRYDGEHYWVGVVMIRYQYRGGQWVELDRTYY